MLYIYEITTSVREFYHHGYKPALANKLQTTLYGRSNVAIVCCCLFVVVVVVVVINSLFD